MDDFPGVFQIDRKVEGGCSGKRPDCFANLLTHTLIGEIVA